MKSFLLTSAAIGAIASVAAVGVARAADPITVIPPPVVVAPAPIPEPEKIWAGGYIGGHAALARGHLRDALACEDDEIGPATAFFFIEGPLEDFDVDGDCDWNELAGTLNPDQDADDVGYFLQEDVPPGTRGYLAGVQIGFNFQLGNPNGFVIGAEVSHSYANIQMEYQAIAPFVVDTGEIVVEDFAEWNGRFEISRLTTATLRVGFAFGRVLAYGEVGLAIAQASGTSTLGFADTEMAHGLVYGGGLEVMAGNDVSLFFEYNRVRLTHGFLGTSTLTLEGVPLPPLVLPTQAGVHSGTNIFKVGFNIHL
ncbi:MAG: outer membrane protein [Bauldia sp.]